jgi:hypothetical protein
MGDSVGDSFIYALERAFVFSKFKAKDSDGFCNISDRGILRVLRGVFDDFSKYMILTG